MGDKEGGVREGDGEGRREGRKGGGREKEKRYVGKKNLSAVCKFTNHGKENGQTRYDENLSS